jgi:hypothetical protein
MDVNGSSGNGFGLNTPGVDRVATTQKHDLVSEHDALVEYDRVPGIEQSIVQTDVLGEFDQMCVSRGEYSGVGDVPVFA